MAFRHGRFGDISVNGKDLSAFCASADVNIKGDTSETSTFLATWKTAIAGLVGATVALSGYYDPTATTGPQAVLTPLLGAAAFPVLFYPGGILTGQTLDAFNALLTDYVESSKTTERVNFTAALLVTGVITFSVQ